MKTCQHMLEDLDGSENDLKSYKDRALVPAGNIMVSHSMEQAVAVHDTCQDLATPRRHQREYTTKCAKLENTGHSTPTELSWQISTLLSGLDAVTTINTICGDPQSNNITKLILHSMFNK